MEIAGVDVEGPLFGVPDPVFAIEAPRGPSEVSLLLSAGAGSAGAPGSGALRSGLDCWLVAFRFGLRAPFNRPTGDGERL